ncbi:hypothetical protein I6E85_11285 [Pseudoalteromonas sp. NZS71]|uniref:hypothetical protein n=1 Tax=unclassified Pseudoalteromonas TaxID=194690 RepID=UPI000463D5EC|nr:MULTISPECIES: hypothetical protein [unclassified Pseudoalteromonas]MBH0061739.1 hypothetical protein [Pseudoalteromonas sp. NZS71]|tara:strand:- start:80 stop:466 length:387 start_codon:yes stop_codon:yes gene_type:complete
MSSIIKVTARIKRESKLGVHLVNDSQLSGYPNELIRLAIQGLLFESLVNNGGEVKLSVNQSNHSLVSSSLNKASNAVEKTQSKPEEQTQIESVEQVEEDEDQLDLVPYLGRYIDDSDFNFTDSNGNPD